MPHKDQPNPAMGRVTLAYRTVKDHPILADVCRPNDSRRCPVLVYLHGGGLITGNRYAKSEGSVHARLLHLAEQQGYALISLDYRLAPESKLPAIANDIEAAFSWLGGEAAHRLQLDANRIVVVGDSAGGYLTLLTGFRVNPKPSALVAFYGYGELNADWYAKPNPYPNYTRDIVSREEVMRQTDGTVISDSSLRKGDGGKIYMHYRQTGLWPQEVSGFSRESISRDLAPYEPVRNVTREYPPTLLIHGTLDTDVPFEESKKMAEQFVRHGVPHILRPIEKAEHALAGGDPAQVEDAYRTMREFTLRYLESKNGPPAGKDCG